MLEIIEKKVDVLLRPTSINLAPYVINPYQGCQMGCLFCYAQFSKSAAKEKIPWGDYVKVKTNAVEILERELKEITPQRVLIGSTTECFQPIEEKYKITEAVLELLNERKIPYIILTRSLLINNYLPVIKKGFCEAVYFTVDTLPAKLKGRFKTRICLPEQSIRMINTLCENKINAIAYFCPVMPWLFDCRNMMMENINAERAEFEIINFKMAGIDKIMHEITRVYPEIAGQYEELLKNKDFFEKTMSALKYRIIKAAEGKIKAVKVHVPEYEEYFHNVY